MPPLIVFEKWEHCDERKMPPLIVFEKWEHCDEWKMPPLIVFVKPIKGGILKHLKCLL
jgi:hypothetical protein